MSSPNSLAPGWFLRLSYELGYLLEPASAHSKSNSNSHTYSHAHTEQSAQATTHLSTSWPLAQAARIDDALLYEHATRQWFGVGNFSPLLAPLLAPLLPPLLPPLSTAVNPNTLNSVSHNTLPQTSLPQYSLSEPVSNWGQTGYKAGVRSVINLINAGDCYQVNLAHALKASFQGSSRALFADLAARSQPRFGMYAEHDDSCPEPGNTPLRHAFLSLSPELFLAYDAPTRTLMTRPMKGTRSISHVAAAHAITRELIESVKDQAELAMIVDMMRNDLGKSAELGSVRVDVSRQVEHHGVGPGAVLQATGVVSATLRADLDLADALCNAFPPAS